VPGAPPLARSLRQGWDGTNPNPQAFAFLSVIPAGNLLLSLTAYTHTLRLKADPRPRLRSHGKPLQRPR